MTAVAVTGGDLVVDFEQDLYDTYLNLHHLELGKAVFEVGSLGWYFLATQKMEARPAGALSLDGEAGYFFDLKSWQGGIQGITLWDTSR